MTDIADDTRSHSQVGPLVVKAEMVHSIWPSTLEALCELPNLKSATNNEVVATMRVFFEAVTKGLDPVESTEPQFVLLEGPDNTKVVNFRGFRSQRDRQAGSIAYAGFKSDDSLTRWIKSKIKAKQEENGSNYDYVAFGIHNGVVLMELDFTYPDPVHKHDPQGVLGMKNIFVAIPMGMSNHETIKALENAGELLTRNLRDEIDGGRNLPAEELQIKVML